jgi:hypothetical protein
MHFHLRVITIGRERIDAAAGNTSSAGWDGTHGGALAAACAGIYDLRHSDHSPRRYRNFFTRARVPSDASILTPDAKPTKPNDGNVFPFGKRGLQQIQNPLK